MTNRKKRVTHETVNDILDELERKGHDFVRDTEVYKNINAISQTHGYSCDEAARTGFHAVFVYCNDKGINIQNAMADAKARCSK